MKLPRENARYAGVMLRTRRNLFTVARGRSADRSRGGKKGERKGSEKACLIYYPAAILKWRKIADARVAKLSDAANEIRGNKCPPRRWCRAAVAAAQKAQDRARKMRTRRRAGGEKRWRKTAAYIIDIFIYSACEGDG